MCTLSIKYNLTSYLTHKEALYPVLSPQLLSNTQLRAPLRHFSRLSQYTQIISTLSSKMKNIFCFVFLLTFALVLGRQDVQKKMIASCITNTDRALESLEEVGLGTFETWTTERDRGLVDPPVSKGCENDMNANKIVKAEMGIRYIRYKFQTTCYLIGNANLVLFMKSKTEKVPPGGKQCTENAAFQAVFLPFEYNANTYMSLNPATAPWFFTAPLTGCDIFVATNPDQPNQPIVIHSNLQEHREHNLVNLELKGIYADKILADSAHPGYQLIARVYHKPSPREEMDVNNYLEEYKKTTNKSCS